MNIKKVYFYGNWELKNKYIGEPQKTLLKFAEFLKRKNFKAEKITKPVKVKIESEVIIIFGSTLTIAVRLLLFIIKNKKIPNIKFVISKEKGALKDFLNLIRNINNISGLKEIPFLLLAEALIPKIFDNLFLKIIKRKILYFCYPKEGQSSIISYILEKSELFKFVKNRYHYKLANFKVVYFGRDSFSRGVDTLEKLSSQGINIKGYFPFKGYLFENNLTGKWSIYKNDPDILKKVKAATFTLFPFRNKWAGPDIPTSLIESFLVGTPPIISKVLLFDMLTKNKYPLVTDGINEYNIIKIINKYINKRENYHQLLAICNKIRNEIINQYSFSYEELLTWLKQSV